MKPIIPIIVIILFAPNFLLAHEGEVNFAIDPTTLPGERGYFFEKVGEWIEINLFTLSTKQKQEKKLKLSDERIAELLALLERKEIKNKNLQEAWRGYESRLLDAESMAEKIIVLDGQEIALAEKFERATRIHEQVLAEALENRQDKIRPIILQALNLARIQNETIFKFMVKNYQATDADLGKHKRILEEHLILVRQISSQRLDTTSRKEMEPILQEAIKFQKAGLNPQSYDWVNRAKNLIYSRIIFQF